MRVEDPARAFVRSTLTIALAWLVAACAAPSGPETGSVEGRVTEGGVIALSGVVVHAQGQTTLTDGDGRFTLDGITVPYDLRLSQSSGDGWLHVLEGLTDRTPDVDPVGFPPFGGSPTATDVSGTLSGGGGWPLPAGRRVVVCAVGIDDVVFGCDTLAPGATSYSFTTNLLTGAAADVRLHALRILVDGAGRPTGYEGYGAAEASFEAGVPAVVPIDLNVVPAVQDLDVAFDVPGGASLTAAFVVVRLADGGSLLLFEGPVAADTLTLPVPVFLDARYGVFAYALSGGGSATAWSVVDGFDAGTLAFPVPPQLAAPAVDATGVTPTTPFDVVSAGPGARTFRWTSSAGPAVALTTTRSSVTLPDLEAAGLAWPSGATYSWNVVAHEAADVDEALAVLDPQVVFLALFTGVDVASPGAYAQSDDRSFTTAP